jgi:hypothetical protein
MRLSSVATHVLEFRGRDPVLAPLVIGAGLAAGITALFLTGPRPFTTERIVTALAVAAVAAVLISFGWPRVRWVRIRLADRIIESDRTLPAKIDAGAVLRLVDAHADRVAERPIYGGVLELGGSKFVLSSAREPDKVLTDIKTVEQGLDLPVRGGWGVTARPRPELSPRRLSIAMVTCWIGFSALAIVEVVTRLQKGDVPSWLALTLPASGIVVLGAIVLVVTTRRVRFSMGEELCCEWLFCGVVYARRSVRRASIRDAALVGPDGVVCGDLLLETDGGPVSFPCDAREGSRIARALDAGTGFAGSGHGIARTRTPLIDS